MEQTQASANAGSPDLSPNPAPKEAPKEAPREEPRRLKPKEMRRNVAERALEVAASTAERANQQADRGLDQTKRVQEGQVLVSEGAANNAETALALTDFVRKITEAATDLRPKEPEPRAKTGMDVMDTIAGGMLQLAKATVESPIGQAIGERILAGAARLLGQATAEPVGPGQEQGPEPDQEPEPDQAEPDQGVQVGVLLKQLPDELKGYTMAELFEFFKKKGA